VSRALDSDEHIPVRSSCDDVFPSKHSIANGMIPGTLRFCSGLTF
jgi:hypothetical protein